MSKKTSHEIFQEQELGGLKGVNKLPVSTHPLFSSTPGTLAHIALAHCQQKNDCSTE